MNIANDPINTHQNLIYKNRIKGYSLYLSILVVFVFILLLLPVIRIDVSTQGRGIIRSDAEPISISSITSGRIQYINLKNNQIVNKGDTLLKLSIEQLDLDRQNTKINIDEQQKILIDLENIDNKIFDSFQTSVIREEYNAYIANYKELSSKVKQADINLKRHQKLFNKGLISASQIEEYNFSYSQLISSLENLKSKYFSEWKNRKITTKEKLNTLKNTYDKIFQEKRNYVIVAPENGSIENFSGLQKNSFLLASQPIATLSPNTELLAEIYVLPKDIGLIKKGQEVKFQMDAFNYNQWGIITGKIIDIDKNITKEGNEVFFKVRCALDKKEMTLKNGYKASITKGMTLTARFIINRRSLFQLLFDKVDDWLNPTRDIHLKN